MSTKKPITVKEIRAALKGTAYDIKGNAKRPALYEAYMKY